MPNQVTPGPAHGSLGPFLTHPLSMVGTDSTFVGAKPSPRTWGSFPRILGEFVRDQRVDAPRDGGAQDDLGAGRTAGHPGPGPAAGRHARRHRGLRSGHASARPRPTRSRARSRSGCRTWWSTGSWSWTASTRALPGRAARRPLAGVRQLRRIIGVAAGPRRAVRSSDSDLGRTDAPAPDAPAAGGRPRRGPTGRAGHMSGMRTVDDSMPDDGR